jgi:hypothetical protein
MSNADDNNLSVPQKGSFVSTRKPRSQQGLGSGFSGQDQVKYCFEHLDGKTPSSSQLSRVWIAREEWKNVDPAREVQG